LLTLQREHPYSLPAWHRRLHYESRAQGSSDDSGEREATFEATEISFLRGLIERHVSVVNSRNFNIKCYVNCL